jgi:Uma2 family endonuclease
LAERLSAYHRRVSEAIAFISFDSFVEEEQSSERRHELVGGRIYAMAGGSERHDLAAGLLYELLAPGARSAGCRPFTSNRLVRTRGGNAYYPDVMVVGGPAAHRLYEADPAVLIEVLSPSTADQDRREKPVAYAESVSLALLALVDPDVRRIEVARPVDGAIRSWTVYGPGDVISSPFGDIDVDALYDTIDQTATTT